jgi:hypothetical protein
MAVCCSDFGDGVHVVAALHLAIEPEDAAGVDGRELGVVARQQIAELASARFERARRHVVRREDQLREFLQRRVFVGVEQLRLVHASVRSLIIGRSLMDVLRGSQIDGAAGSGHRERDLD